MNYARARLRLGITSVGTLVVGCATALVLDLPARTLPTTPALLPTEFGALAAAFGVYLLVQLPFDVVGGHLLPRRHGRDDRSAAAWLAGWFRGVSLQAVWFVGSALIVLELARGIGPVAGFGAVVAATLLLIAGQAAFARGLGGLRAYPAPIDDLGVGAELLARRTVRRVDHDDVGFTGGWTGWPGRETLLVPGAWIDELPREQLEAELVRRASVVSTGARSRGLLLAAAFDLAGFALAAFVLGGDLVSVAGLVTVALWVTLWSFLGALVLPSLSRPAVYGADQAARDHGIDADVLAATARTLDRRQDDEPRRPRVVETIFHPIPAVERRVDALDAGHPARSGAWHTARQALFLSWASFGLLGRAVHCNCGRPELWALLPAD